MEIDTIEKTNNLMNIGMIDTSFDSTKKFIDDMQIITLKYLAAIKEVENRIDIINEDFKVHKGTSPIEHVSSRVKSPLSILNKLSRMNVQFFDIKTMEELNEIKNTKNVGDKITLKVKRKNEEKEIKVTLGSDDSTKASN